MALPGHNTVRRSLATSTWEHWKTERRPRFPIGLLERKEARQFPTGQALFVAERRWGSTRCAQPGRSQGAQGLVLSHSNTNILSFERFQPAWQQRIDMSLTGRWEASRWFHRLGEPPSGRRPSKTSLVLKGQVSRVVPRAVEGLSLVPVHSRSLSLLAQSSDTPAGAGAGLSNGRAGLGPSEWPQGWPVPHFLIPLWLRWCQTAAPSHPKTESMTLSFPASVV